MVFTFVIFMCFDIFLKTIHHTKNIIKINVTVESANCYICIFGPPSLSWLLFSESNQFKDELWKNTQSRLRYNSIIIVVSRMKLTWSLTTTLIRFFLFLCFPTILDFNDRTRWIIYEWFFFPFRFCFIIAGDNRKDNTLAMIS